MSLERDQNQPSTMDLLQQEVDHRPRLQNPPNPLPLPITPICKMNSPLLRLQTTTPRRNQPLLLQSTLLKQKPSSKSHKDRYLT